MANTASRLSANGSLTISGSFDEVSGTYVTSGLIGSWDVNKSYYPQTDASTWYDMAGNNNIKIYNNNGTPALFSPSSNSANITFYTTNGSSSSLGSYGVVDIPQLATTANVTLEGVFNINQIVGMLGGFATYDIYMAGGALGFNTASGEVYGISAATVTSLNLRNRNVHYVFVFPTSNLPGAYQLWINGVQQSLSLVGGSSTPSTRFYNNRGDYAFQLNGWYAGTPTNGAIPPAGTYYGNASWSSFRMYNRVLTPAEIQQNFNIASARYQLGSTVNPVVTATRSNNTTQTITQAISGEFDEVTYNPIANVAINLFNHTQDFSNAYWNNRLTITSSSALAPDNTYTATLFTYNLEYALIQNSTNFNITNTFGKTYTFSCYVKATTSYIALVTNSVFCNFKVDDGTIGGGNGGIVRITKEANGFYRCSLTFTSTSTTENFAIWLAGYTNGVFTGQTITMWGPQVELNSVVTPYQAKGASGLLQSNTAMKTTNTGNTFIKGSYDEYSKMSPITEGLVFNVDPGYEGSYVGSGAAMYDTTSNRYKVDLLGNSTPKYSSDYGGILKFTSTFGNNEYANTNFPSSAITPTSNYTMSAWVKFNRSNSGLAEYQFYNPVTGSLVSPQANTGFAYGSAGSILGTTYYGDYGLFWYSQIGTSGEKQLLVGFQNRVTPYAQASPQQVYTMNDSLIFFNWTHIVGVLNNAGNFAGFYVNGVLVNSTTASQIASGSFPYAFPTIRICADNVAGGNALGRNFDGDTGPMSIWNRALSASEIQQMYSSQRSRFGV